MITRELMSSLMAEVGPLANLLSVRENEDASLWQLEMDDETIVFAEFHEARGMLALDASVGAPPEKADSVKLYRLLLEYNVHGDETGGVVLALDREGLVILCFRLPAADLDAADLATVLVDFRQKLSAWRTIVHNFASSGAKTSEDLTMAGFLRA